MKLMWGRVIVAGVLAEILYFLYLQFVLGDLLAAYRVSGMIGVVVCLMLGGIWAGRGTPSRPLLHGVLVGVAAILFFFVLNIAFVVLAPDAFAEADQPEIAVSLFLLNHGLKLVGGGVGGYIGGSLRRNPGHIAG